MAYKMVNTGICTIMRIYLLQIMEGVLGITGQVDTIRSALLPFNTYMPGLCVLDCAQASLCEYCGIGVFEDDPYFFCRPISNKLDLLNMPCIGILDCNIFF